MKKRNIVLSVALLICGLFVIALAVQVRYLNEKNRMIYERMTTYEQKALDWQTKAEDYEIKLLEAQTNLELCSKEMERLETKLVKALDALSASEQKNNELSELLNQQETITINEYSAIKMSSEERELLEWMLALEAKEQPDVGQRAVVEVAFNRVLSSEWQDTVYNVIMAKGQFDSMNYMDEPYATPSQKERNNIDYVLEHGRTVLPADYVFFATYKANGKDFIKIGDHYFSRAK